LLPDRRSAWIGLGALWIVGFIGALTRFVMAFYQVRISEDLGIGRGILSAAWSSNLLIAALCAPLGGWLADRFGPKKVLLASALFSLIGTGTVAVGQNGTVFFIGYGIVAGLAGIGSTTTYLLLFAWFKRHRAKATGLLASASSLGLAIVTPIFVSADSLGWRDAFAAAFVLGLVVTLPVILLGIRDFVSRRDASEGNGGAPEPTVRASRPIGLLPVMIVVSAALFACGFNMGTVEMNLVAIHQLADVAPGRIALSMSVLGIMEIVGSLLFGYGLDRFDRRLVMTVLYGVRVAGFALLFFHLGASPLVFAVAFGITYLSAIPGGLLVASEVSETSSGKQTGWLLMFHQAGGILGSLFGGFSFDYSGDYQALIVVDVFVCAFVALGYGLLYANRKRAISQRRINHAAVKSEIG